MANRYVRSTGGNWNAAATWELTPGGGESVAIPTSADEVYLVSGSGQLTINATAACRRFDCTSYANTITHSTYTLTVGDGTAPTGGVAMILAGTYNISADTSAITFNSSDAGIHTIDFNNNTIGTLSFNNSASYQMQNNWTMRSTSTLIWLSAGTLDTNGYDWSGGGVYIAGASAKTLTLGDSVFTSTVQSGGNAFTVQAAGALPTITANTAKVIIAGSTCYCGYSSGIDWNGLTFVLAGTGNVTFYGSNTIKDIIINPSASNNLILTAGSTLTLTSTGNTSNCYGQNTKFVAIYTTSSGNTATISKPSGTFNFFGCTIKDINATGGATYNAPSSADISGNSGINFTSNNNEFLCMDYELGNDSTTDTPYGWWSVDYTGSTGAAPIEGETATGASSGSTAKVTGRINLYDWSNGYGTLYFYGKSNAFQAETVNLSGGGSFSIAGDFTYCAWKTITTGATSARIANSTTIRIARSSAPVSIGSATWTGTTEIGGGFPSTVTITGAANNGSGLIRLTTSTAHGLTTNDVAQVLGVIGTVEANGTWFVTYVDYKNIDLQGSTFVNTWGSGAGQTIQKINSKAVVLVTPQTLDVNNCDTNWTAANASTVTLIPYTTDAKEGQSCVKIAKTSPANNTLYAYKAISLTNYSSYQKISFWIKNTTTILENQWNLCLCSDSSGTTVVDTFAIPAIPYITTGNYIGRWTCLTIERNGGGNLGSSIQSVALYSGSSAGTTSGISLDNIIACTTNGLNLQSLISKNSLEQGGDEGWYAIQSINNKIILLDNDTNIKSNYGRGYSTSGISPETLTTYIRETIKTDFATAEATQIQALQKSGTDGKLIFYEGGYNTTTNAQTGETFFDGLNGSGYGIYTAGRSYIGLNYLNATRYWYGFYLYCNSSIIGNISNANNNSYGIVIYGSLNTIGIIRNANNNGGRNTTNSAYSNGNIWTAGQWTNNTINTIGNCNNCEGTHAIYYVGGYARSNNIGSINNINNNTGNGFLFYTNNSNNTIGAISNVNYNSSGIQFYSSNNNSITTITNCNYNITSGVFFSYSYNNIIYNLSTKGNISAISNSGNNYIRNWNDIEPEEILITNIASSGGSIRITTSPTSLLGYNMICRIRGVTGTTEANGIWVINSPSTTLVDLPGSTYINTYTGGGTIQIISSVIRQGTSVDSKIYCWNYRLIPDNHVIFADYGMIQTTTEDSKRHTASGVAWKFSPFMGTHTKDSSTGSARNSTYPLIEKLAEIPVNAGSLVTVKCWVLKDHAVYVAAALAIKGGYLSGIPTDILVNKTNDTNWEQLTLTCTPMEKGILKVEGWAWVINNAPSNNSVYFDDLEISQA